MNEKELLDNGFRKYRGEKIDVFFNKDTCIHSGNCVTGNADVFDTERRPWILADGAESEEVARVIDTCPSGALKYIHRGQTEAMPVNTPIEKEGI